jgi:hypothetical protein
VPTGHPRQVEQRFDNGLFSGFGFNTSSKQPNAAGNAPPHTMYMRGYVMAVAFSRLLDRRLIESFNQRDLNTRNTRPAFSLPSEARLTPLITRRPCGD